MQFIVYWVPQRPGSDGGGNHLAPALPVLNTFKITTFPHLDHRSNMNECSFYKGIIHRNAKTRPSICSNWQVVCKDANCATNAEIKYGYLVSPMQKQKHN